MKYLPVEGGGANSFLCVCGCPPKHEFLNTQHTLHSGNQRKSTAFKIKAQKKSGNFVISRYQHKKKTTGVAIQIVSLLVTAEFDMIG